MNLKLEAPAIEKFAKMHKQRFAVLDTYRFIAAVGIVLFHYEASFQPFLRAPLAPLASFNLSVDFFFILSGFVLMHTYGDKIATFADYAKFMRKRLARVYPLHAVTTLAFVAMAIAIAALDLKVDLGSTFDVGLAPAALLLIHAWGVTDHSGLNYPSWSISAEVFVYLMFPLFAVALARIGGVRILCLAAALVMAIALWRSMSGLRPYAEATHDFGNLRAVPTFLAGMATSAIVSALPARKVHWWLAHGAAVVVATLMLVGAPALLIVAAMPFVIGLLASAERSGVPSRLASPFCKMLGDASYGIYLLHALIIVLLTAVLKKIPAPSLPMLITIAFIGTALTTSIAIASFRWFEDPMRRALGQSRRSNTAKLPVRSMRGIANQPKP